MVLDKGFWDFWLAAPPTPDRRLAWDAAKPLAAEMLAIEPHLRVPVVLHQHASKGCTFCGTQRVRKVYAPWGWRCCGPCKMARTVAEWELPHGLGKAQLAAAYPAGWGERYSRYNRQRVRFDVWSKTDVERAARRLWKVGEGEDLVDKAETGNAARKELVRAKLVARKKLSIRKKAEKAVFAALGRLPLDAGEDEVEKCVDEVIGSLV